MNANEREEAEAAVLKHFTDPREKSGLDFADNRTLGDLVTVALIGREHLTQDSDGLPQQWETLENAFSATGRA